MRAGHLSRKPGRGRGPSSAAARRSVDPAAAAAAGRHIRARVGAGAAVSGGRAALLGAHVRLAPGRARARRPELREGGSERAGPRLRGRPPGAPARPAPPPGAPRGGRCPARALLATEAGGLTRAREARRGEEGGPGGGRRSPAEAGPGSLRWPRGCRCFRFWCATTGRCRALPLPPPRSAPWASAPPPPGRPLLPPPSSGSHGGSRLSGRRPPSLRRGHLPSAPRHPAVINGERGETGGA